MLAQSSPGPGGRDGGSVSVGDAALTSVAAPVKADPGNSSGGVIAEESPPVPVPGQLKPDRNGRCRKGQAAINGGCWWKLDADPDDCHGSVFPYKNGCYAPAFPPSREPTSAPKP